MQLDLQKAFPLVQSVAFDMQMVKSGSVVFKGRQTKEA